MVTDTGPHKTSSILGLLRREDAVRERWQQETEASEVFVSESAIVAVCQVKEAYARQIRALAIEVAKEQNDRDKQGRVLVLPRHVEEAARRGAHQP